MSHSYQQLLKFLRDQVEIVGEPFELNSQKLESLLERHGGDAISTNRIKKVIADVNDHLEHYIRGSYSQQAISQAAEQICTLWKEQAAQQEALIDKIKELDLPVDLKSDYKLYALNDILRDVEMLPILNLNAEDDTDGNESFVEYNNKREQVVEKTLLIKKTQQKVKALNDYANLVELKIGQRQNIQQNIPSSKNTLREEVARLTIILEKLKNLNETKRQRLLKILEQNAQLQT